MADIADHVDQISAAIFDVYANGDGASKSRTYLGASIVGYECKRRLWYAFRWGFKEKFEGRMLRLFQTGHLEEPRMVADLRAIGCTVYDVDPATGKQFGFSEHGGHMKGHMDGAGSKIPGGGSKWHVLEFKTHSAKSFGELKKKGVREAKPEHFTQMNWYMGKTGMDRALYLAKNKDNDDLYSERVEFDHVHFEETNAKAESIIFSGSPPSKISQDFNYYLCKMCPARSICHLHQVQPATCRSCVHSTPEREGDGRWSCAKHGPEIPLNVSRVGCGDHLPLPFLLTYAEAIDAGDGWIEFKRINDDKHFVVSSENSAITTAMTGMPTYYSREISAATDHMAICNDGVEVFRNTLGARIENEAHAEG